MAENTAIEWAHHTANLWWGCTKVKNNPCCDNCYAEVWDKRYGKSHWGDDAPRRAIKGVWKDLTKWQKDAAAKNTQYRVFTMSMGDIFEKPMPLVNAKEEKIYRSTEELRNLLFTNIDYHFYPNLIFLMLTKRITNVVKMVPESWLENWPKNVWLGTSIGDQKNWDNIIPKFIKIPATTKFVSMEPLVEKVNVAWSLKHIDWIIVGGESGQNARPMNPEWVQSIHDACKKWGVPFFFKQWGEYLPINIPNGSQLTDQYTFQKVGKKRAGRRFLSQEWNELPEIAK